MKLCLSIGHTRWNALKSLSRTAKLYHNCKTVIQTLSRNVSRARLLLKQFHGWRWKIVANGFRNAFGRLSLIEQTHPASRIYVTYDSKAGVQQRAETHPIKVTRRIDENHLSKLSLEGLFRPDSGRTWNSSRVIGRCHRFVTPDDRIVFRFILIHAPPFTYFLFTIVLELTHPVISVLT